MRRKMMKLKDEFYHHKGHRGEKEPVRIKGT